MALQGQFIVILVGFIAVIESIKVGVSAPPEDDLDQLWAALESQDSGSSESLGLGVNSLPYESHAGVQFEAYKPPGEFALSTGNILSAQLEVLRLVEAFLSLKGQIANHFLAIFYQNYEVIKGLATFAVAQIPNLHAFLLKGVSVLRLILEFAVRTFADWRITLPSLSVSAGAQTNGFVQPHPTYGVPAATNVAEFVKQFDKTKNFFVGG